MRRVFVFILLSITVSSFAQQEQSPHLDSLLSELASESYDDLEDTSKARFLADIAAEYFAVNKDSSEKYASRALELSESLNYGYGTGRALQILGDVYYNDFHIGLRYYFGALRQFEQIKDNVQIGGALRGIGGIYYNMEQYHKALAYFNKGLNYFRKAGDENGINISHHSIAATYINLKDFTSALHHQSIALTYFEQQNIVPRMAIAYSNLADCYAGLRDYNRALAYSSKGTELLRSLKKTNYSFATALSDMGYIYYRIANDQNFIIRPDSLMPATRSENLAKAFEYYNEAYIIYKSLPGYVDDDILARLSEAYAAAGNYSEAYRLYKQYVKVKDSLLSVDTRVMVANQETLRETDLKDSQIKINSIQAANKKKERILFLAIFGLLAVVMISIYRSNKRKSEANIRLAVANKELAEANTNIALEKDRSDQLASDLKESLMQKEAFAAQLSIAAEMKTKFLANLSHELRTPVTLLTGMLELMKANDDKLVATGEDRRNKERLDVAYNNSCRLQYMIDEILDLSRLETKETKLDLKPIEIGTVIRRMVFAFETFIEREHLRLDFHQQNTKNIYVAVDEGMLEKIVNNLVYNAIKFNVHGGWVKVDIDRSEDGKEFIFSINNSGTIIKPHDLPHIFERFYQGDTSAVKAEGVGIGLSLVKEFTLLMSGTVDVTSREGEGTTFTVCFPVTQRKAVEVEEEVVLSSPEWGHFNRKQNVLIVEDNTEMRYYLTQILADKVAIHEATNGKEALKWLESNNADLIITDLMMPEMDGRKLIATLKDSDKLKKVPVIAISALADAANRIELLRFGIDDYMVKPFNATELRVRAYNLLNHSDERRQFENKPFEPDDVLDVKDDGAEFKEKVSEFILSRINVIDISVYDLAYELALSERQLYRLSKRLTGCTPAQLIKEVKLQRAYELLLGGTINKIDDLARQVGYESAGYFSRQFFERFGKRPTEFL